MKFYKIRAFLLIFLTRSLGRILAVEVPPVLSVSALIEKEGKMLFLDHTYIDGYGLPGGLVKIGEGLEAAIRREVKEETGLDIASLEYFASIPSLFRGIPTIGVTFIVSVAGTEKGSSEGKIVWLLPHEAVKRMAYPGAMVTLQRYMDVRSL